MASAMPLPYITIRSCQNPTMETMMQPLYCPAGGATKRQKVEAQMAHSRALRSSFFVQLHIITAGALALTSLQIERLEILSITIYSLHFVFMYCMRVKEFDVKSWGTMSITVTTFGGGELVLALHACLVVLLFSGYGWRRVVGKTYLAGLEPGHQNSRMRIAECYRL